MTSSSQNKEHDTPSASSETARNRMKAVRQVGTLPELLIREALDSLDLTYEVNAQPLSDLQRFADILFREEKVAVFVDGCFWHGCPIHGTQAKANKRFWAEKIARNKERDRDTDRQLGEAGWTVLRIWEHEDPETAAKRIQSLLLHSNHEDQN